MTLGGHAYGTATYGGTGITGIALPPQTTDTELSKRGTLSTRVSKRGREQTRVVRQ